MWLQLLLVVVSIFVILFGANYLTDGAAALAARFRIPELIIGLTVVAFGTSAPELTVSVLGSLSGNGGIAVGNVIGSNIFNVLCILGITAMITPLDVDKNSRSFDIPIALIASLVLGTILMDNLLDGRPSDVTRVEALFLLLMGVLFLLYTIYMGKKGSSIVQAKQANEEVIKDAVNHKPWWYILLTIPGGLALLIFGSKLFVDNASTLATNWGVSNTLIGLTLVSWGTSAPELATSVVAAIKKNNGIAVGNVIGSNIFNIFFVLGAAGIVNPLVSLEFTYLDLFMQLFAVLILLFFTIWIGKNQITRMEGGMLFLIFITYTGYIIYNGLNAGGTL